MLDLDSSEPRLPVDRRVQVACGCSACLTLALAGCRVGLGFCVRAALSARDQEVIYIRTVYK